MARRTAAEACVRADYGRRTGGRPPSTSSRSSISTCQSTGPQKAPSDTMPTDNRKAGPMTDDLEPIPAVDLNSTEPQRADLDTELPIEDGKSDDEKESD